MLRSRVCQLDCPAAEQQPNAYRVDASERQSADEGVRHNFEGEGRRDVNEPRACRGCSTKMGNENSMKVTLQCSKMLRK